MVPYRRTDTFKPFQTRPVSHMDPLCNFMLVDIIDNICVTSFMTYHIKKFVKMLMVTSEFKMVVSSNHALSGNQLKKKTIWFVRERQFNGQRQLPGWIQFRHDKFRIERWRKIPYKDNNTLKTNITKNM